MAEKIERLVGTRGREENIALYVIFPYNEDDVREMFEEENLENLYFADAPESKMSLSNFNRIVLQADDRMEKIREEIEATVKFLKKQMKAHSDWKGTSETKGIPYEDGVIWKYFMKDSYKNKDEKVRVWVYKGEMVVYYGEQKKG